jgi:hypothetical protein
VDVDPGNPRYPFVQVFGGTESGSKSIPIQTSQNGLSIIRPLTHEEMKNDANI